MSIEMEIEGVKCATIGQAVPYWKTEAVDVLASDRDTDCDVCWETIPRGHRFVIRDATDSEVIHWRLTEFVCWKCAKATDFKPLTSPLDHRSEWLTSALHRRTPFPVVVEKAGDPEEDADDDLGEH